MDNAKSNAGEYGMDAADTEFRRRLAASKVVRGPRNLQDVHSAQGANIKGEMLNAMLVLATGSHANQYDKGGNPYILHPLAVMQLLNTDDEELQCIALGHDLVEDTKVTWKQLEEIGFSERIIKGIQALTKLPGETYEQYKMKVRDNWDAVEVKMCDLQHNTDIRRIRGITDKDHLRVQRYFQFYYELREWKARYRT